MGPVAREGGCLPRGKGIEDLATFLDVGDWRKKLKKKKKAKINISTNCPFPLKLKKSCIISARLSTLMRQ